jgi:(S)-2-hydroxyglutarate dehydrogenase
MVYDVIVVGAGILGLATARALLERQPGLRLAVVEKEKQVGAHQTSHNSGVIHAGIYYLPGTLKARLCIEGGAALFRYCTEHGINAERCGQVIVATDEREVARLRQLYHRGRANGVGGLELVNPARLQELEPYCQGLEALWSPETGIVDYGQVAHSFGMDLRNAGGEIHTGRQVLSIRQLPDRLILQTNAGDLECRHLITCAGLQADRLARMTGGVSGRRIVPLRGDYWQLRPRAGYLCRNLIFSVPDPSLPFLGVHAARVAGGRQIRLGPSGMTAFASTGQVRLDFRARDILSVVGYGGFRHFLARQWRRGSMGFWRDHSKRALLAVIQRLLPDVTSSDLIPSLTGVRAQSLDGWGRLVDDFTVDVSGGRVLHVRSAPAPAATCSMALGRLIAARAAVVFGE